MKTPYLYNPSDDVSTDNESKFGIGAPANQEVSGEIYISSSNYCCCSGAGAANKTEYKK